MDRKHRRDHDDDWRVNPTDTACLETVIERRRVLQSLAAGAALAVGGARRAMAGSKNPSTLTFRQVERRIKKTHQVAAGYRADVLIRWGDAVMADAPIFDPGNLTPAAQARQFGTNNDFIAFMPFGGASDHGLLSVNHEYCSSELMWPKRRLKRPTARQQRDQIDVEMAAHGHSVVEVRKTGDRWSVVPGGKFARRLTATTPIHISGPAAGEARMKTTADPSGTRVLGTINNCAGGVTPWGTVLIAEENVHGYFGGDPKNTIEHRNHRRMGLRGRPRQDWHLHHRRFNVEAEPHEPNRFGWVVELDPFDPTSTPVKRTALGRFKHEGATVALAPDGRAVVYMGDDQAGEYIYKFVSRDPVDRDNPRANRNLLDHGTLHAAKFHRDGTVTWLPLVWNQGPLTPADGFAGPADVMIEARRAADQLGATPMDRPEDVEPSPVSGRVYAMLTKNRRRNSGDGGANPRGPNPHGHIIEIIPPGAEGDGPNAAVDHAATRARWEILLLAGDPGDFEYDTKYHPATPAHGAWLSSPDNAAFDNKGRLWIASDQGSKQRKNKIPDGLYGCDLSGPGRALPRMLFAVPIGAEMCGPAFTPDAKTLFVAVQHPGDGSRFDNPSTRWPDFRDGMPPRPAVVVITKKDGGEIGG